MATPPEPGERKEAYEIWNTIERIVGSLGLFGGYRVAGTGVHKDRDGRWVTTFRIRRESPPHDTVELDAIVREIIHSMNITDLVDVCSGVCRLEQGPFRDFPVKSLSLGAALSFWRELERVALRRGEPRLVVGGVTVENPTASDVLGGDSDLVGYLRRARSGEFLKANVIKGKTGWMFSIVERVKQLLDGTREVTSIMTPDPTTRYAPPRWVAEILESKGENVYTRSYHYVKNMLFLEEGGRLLGMHLHDPPAKTYLAQDGQEYRQYLFPIDQVTALLERLKFGDVGWAAVARSGGAKGLEDRWSIVRGPEIVGSPPRLEVGPGITVENPEHYDVPKSESWIQANAGRIIAVDLDATIAEYHGWRGEEVIGDPLPGARESLEALSDQGYIIIVYTARKDRARVARYLESHRIPFDYIESKMYADVYVDDRALRFEGDWDSTVRGVRTARPWYDER